MTVSASLILAQDRDDMMTDGLQHIVSLDNIIFDDFDNMSNPRFDIFAYDPFCSQPSRFSVQSHRVLTYFPM